MKAQKSITPTEIARKVWQELPSGKSRNLPLKGLPKGVKVRLFKSPKGHGVLTLDLGFRSSVILHSPARNTDIDNVLVKLKTAIKAIEENRTLRALVDIIGHPYPEEVEETEGWE